MAMHHSKVEALVWIKDKLWPKFTQKRIKNSVIRVEEISKRMRVKG